MGVGTRPRLDRLERAVDWTVRGVQVATARTADRAARAVLGPGPYRCPVCGRRVRGFAPLAAVWPRRMRAAGWPHPPDRFETWNVARYTCLYCGATDRDRLIALYLGDHLAAAAGPVSVLDFAPPPALSAFVRRAVAGRGRGDRYRTADLYMAGVDDRVDVCDLGVYPDGAFDLLVCSHVLEHVPDDRKAMAELLRVLRPGGRALLLVPIVLGLAATDEDPAVTDPRERWRRFGQDDHVRQYAQSDFVGRLTAAGFVVERLGVAHFGPGRFAEAALTPTSTLYVGYRPAAVEPGHRDG